MNTYPFPYTKPPYIQICLRFFFRFGKGANWFGCQVNLANLNTRVTVSSAEMMTGPRAAASLSLDYNAAERGFTVPKAHTMQALEGCILNTLFAPELLDFCAGLTVEYQRNVITMTEQMII